jgi:hypothetical protein
MEIGRYLLGVWSIFIKLPLLGVTKDKITGVSDGSKLIWQRK